MCAEECQWCASEKDCIDCKEGYYRLHNAGLCAESCPTGFVADMENRTCEGLMDAVFSIVFDNNISHDWVDSIYGTKVIAGARR